MKRRKLILIIADAVLLAVCIIQAVIARHDGVTVFKFSDEPDEIVFTSPAENFTLVKEGEDWFGGEKKYQMTNSSVENLVDSLKKIRALDKVASLSNDAAAERYELDASHKITVVAKKAGKVLRTLSIGKDATAGSQTYISVDDKKDIYLASGNIRSSFDTTLDSLRSRTVWQLDKAAITGVTLRNFGADGESFTVSKMGSGDDITWNISGATVDLDGSKVQNWFDSLASLITPDWYSESEAAGLSGNKIVEAEIISGFNTTKLTIYEIPAEGERKVKYYATSSATPYTFELGTYAAEKFIKNAEDFAK